MLGAQKVSSVTEYVTFFDDERCVDYVTQQIAVGPMEHPLIVLPASG